MYQSVLPFLTVIWPLLGFFMILLFGKKREEMAYGIAILSNLGALASLLMMIPHLQKGETVIYKLSHMFPPFGLNFEVKVIGLFMAILSCFLWLVATIYSKPYLQKKANHRRYYAFLELTLLGCLGVYLTGELFSLFIFFEILSLASFVLVIHNGTKEALEAGYLYLFMGIFGGLSLLLGMTIFYSYGDSHTFGEMLTYFPDQPFLKMTTALLLIIGFGVKAGIFPVHIWLPQAHPVAPSPASALLSGVMIKAGAYGIFLTLQKIFFHDYSIIENLGYLVTWIGMITMLLGAVSALRQKDVKRLLAYSSISQMGYIILALGLATYLGEHGQLGFTGAFFHILNHAIFKVGFFLNIGIIYVKTHKKHLDHLGGLLKEMPLNAILFIIFAGGIIGIPGFNGYASKSLIHHTLSEAIHLKGGVDLIIFEKLFILTGAFTFAYITKLFMNIFLGKRPNELKVYRIPTKLMTTMVITLSGLVLAIGLFPNTVVEKLLLPMGMETGFDQYVGEVFFAHYSFWNSHDLLGVIPYFIIGIILYLAESKFIIFTKLVPAWFGIRQLTEGIIKLVSRTFPLAYCWISRTATQSGEVVLNFCLKHADKLIHFDRDPKKTKIGPVSIASLDFSKLWVAIMLVLFLMLSILKMIEPIA